MAQHIRHQEQHLAKQPHHIRAQDKHQKKGIFERFQEAVQSKAHHIRSSPKMMIGTILFIILLIAVIAAGGHYMRYWTIPKVSFIPQKPAPASHLQYFFF